MITVDGSRGEGGGQIIRTAVGLSAVTQEPVEIRDIRAGRPQPGLKQQHITAIGAVGELCDAHVEGNVLGSKELKFEPKKVPGGSVNARVATAGSLGLVLQALLIAGTAAKKEVRVSLRGGGTWGKWAPPVEYTKYVLAPLLAKMGYGVDINVNKHGFYPRGGAVVDCVLKPGKLKPLCLGDAGKVVAVKGISIASGDLVKSKVADRQAKACRLKLYERLRVAPKINVEYADTECVGSGILIWKECESSVLGASALGGKGVRAEDVGAEAAAQLLKEGGAVDKWAADQLIPFMGLAGPSQLTVSEVTGHAKANAWVTEQFLGKKFSLDRASITVA